MGSRIRRFKVGDLVYSYSFFNRKGGLYAEYVAVAADKVSHVPIGRDLRHAGAIPTTGLTALQGIDDALYSKSGESIIIHSGAGGVGSLAIQFAKLRNARVFATATGDDGVEFVRFLGADAAVDSKRDDIALAARNFAPDGVDAVLGLIGDAFESCIDALRPGGRVAYPNGVEPEPKKRRAFASSHTMQSPSSGSSIGSTARWRRRNFKYRSMRSSHWRKLQRRTRDLWPVMCSGRSCSEFAKLARLPLNLDT